MPSMTIGTLQLLPFESRLSSASSARLPPSPLLSARMISIAYLNVTTIIIDQKTRLSTPWIWTGST